MCLNYTAGRVHGLVWLNASYSKDQDRPLCLCCRCQWSWSVGEPFVYGVNEGGRQVLGTVVTAPGPGCSPLKSQCLGGKGWRRIRFIQRWRLERAVIPGALSWESWVQRGLSWGGRKSGAGRLDLCHPRGGGKGESPFPLCSEQSTTMGFSELPGLTAPTDFPSKGKTSRSSRLHLLVGRGPQSETL